jgi:hypothetical protein
MPFQLSRALLLLIAVALISCQHPPPRAADRVGTGTAPATIPATPSMQPSRGGSTGMISTEYTYLRFDPSEKWQLRIDGPASAAGLRNKTLTFDFSTGAKSIGLVPRDVSMLGQPEEIRLRFRGDTAGHRLRLQLLSHFMSFDRTIEPVAGEGLHVVRIPAPPGEGWRFSGGENDGKLHGPLRVAGLFVEAERGGGASPTRSSGSLELIDIEVKARCPADRTTLITARVQGSPGGPVFVADIHSQIATPTNASLDYVIRDWDGRTVAADSQPLRMDAARPAEFSVPLPAASAGKHVFLEAEFTCRVPGQRIPAATVCYVAPVDHGGSDRLQPGSSWGMGLYLMRYEGEPELMDRAAGMARDIGVKWSREEFSWAMIEPKKGQFDWRFFDRVVATAKSNGISVYGLLDYWSPWTKPYTAEGIEDYCRYVRAVVQRYKRDIHHWEIWNEPNIFFWQGPKEMYAELLKAAYKTIKEVDPDAKVAGCSTSGMDFDFIDRVQQLGGPFDILTIHPYRRKFVDPRFIKELQDASNLVRRDGRPRPVWITEIGWGTHFPHNAIEEGPPVTPREQACRLVRVYVDALASRAASNISWYDFRNDGDNPFEWEHNFGIITQDFQPKPAYRAYATLTRLIGEREFHDQLDLGSGVLAFRFGDPAKDSVIVAWSLDKPRAIMLPASGPMQLTNLMGESRPLPAREGRVELNVDRLVPVFVSPQLP